MGIQSKRIREDAAYDLVMIAMGWIDERWGKIFDWAKERAGRTLKHHRAQEWTWMTWENQVDRVKALDGKVLAIEQAVIQLADRTKKLEEQVAYLEDDAGPRLSEADGVSKQ